MVIIVSKMMFSYLFEILFLFSFFFYRYGARSLQLNKAVPSIIKLLEDQNAQVSICFKEYLSLY